MNRVTGAGVLVEDALFATLDATVRKATTPDGRPFTVTDTVGFVRQLPHQLVEAFRSTLEEVAYADLIVHVVDASHPDPALQIKTVRDVFLDIDATDIPELVVFNKVDLVDRERILELRGLEPAAVLFSAKTGQGKEELLEAISQRLPRPTIDVTVTLPYDRGDLVALVHDHGEVTAISYDEDGTTLRALVDEKTLGQLEPYLSGTPHSG
jgi:GTP-binding protein HflX